MFKHHSIACGAICVAAGIAMALNELAGLAFVLVGVFVAVLVGPSFMRESEGVLKAHTVAIGLMIMGAGIGIVPMDGSWMLFSVTAAFSLAFAWVAAAVAYDFRANPTDKASLRDINRIAVAFGLPIEGLSLVRYLVETDRSVLSGLVAVAVLAWAGYKLAPRTIIRRARPYIRETVA